MTRSFGRSWMCAVAVALLSASCTSSVAQRNTATTPASPATATATADPTRASLIDHLVPRRDSIGPLPARFEWTAVPGADSYSLGIWNEVDMLIWRVDRIPTNSLVRPDDFRLEPGTYFWSVSGLQGGQQIADSGLAAFVVRTVP